MGGSENRDWESLGIPQQHPCLAGLEVWVFPYFEVGKLFSIFYGKLKRKKEIG